MVSFLYSMLYSMYLSMLNNLYKNELFKGFALLLIESQFYYSYSHTPFPELFVFVLRPLACTQKIKELVNQLIL